MAQPGASPCLTGHQEPAGQGPVQQAARGETRSPHPLPSARRSDLGLGTLASRPLGSAEQARASWQAERKAGLAPAHREGP